MDLVTTATIAIVLSIAAWFLFKCVQHELWREKFLLEVNSPKKDFREIRGKLSESPDPQVSLYNKCVIGENNELAKKPHQNDD